MSELKPKRNYCGHCGKRLVRDPNGRIVWHVCTDGHIKVEKA